MILITAIIHRKDVNEIVSSLQENDIHGVTVSEVIGKGLDGLNLKGNEKIDLVPKMRLETVVLNNIERETVVDCLRETCKDYGAGSGKVWWVPVSGVERIRTGERDEAALKNYKIKEIKTQQNKYINEYTNEDTPSS
jgi:nitrogen regulatory protein P-II 1